ncbi:MAG: pteridine reductase [Woeseiaceae bacterium]
MKRIEHEALDGKVALITGAARRIGAAIATTLHAAGVKVIIHYRGSKDAAAELAASLNRQRADSALIAQADLCKAEAIDGLVSTAIQWHDRLDVLVNNASSFYPTAIGQITEAAWSDLVGTNLKAPLFLSQAAAPHLEKTCGNIVNIVDIHARKPLHDHHIYGAAKAGLVTLTQSFAKDLAPRVRVNGVAPGAIAWPENGMTAAVKENIISQIPLGAAGQPSDVADAVLFLVRDATYTTGQIIPIDGGRSIGW